MKKILVILAILATVAGKAQDMSYGITGRLGAHKTVVSSSMGIADNNKYGPGLQLEIGGWLRLPIAAKSAVQFAVLQTIERQSGGTILAVDEYGNDITEPKTRYGNLGAGAMALYLYQYNDKLALGAGMGIRYNYASVMVMQKLEVRGGNAVGGDELYDNTYHRELKVYLPLEVQQRLSPRMYLVGQIQLPLSNRIAAYESVFKERDLGLTVGVNYTL